MKSLRVAIVLVLSGTFFVSTPSAADYDKQVKTRFKVSQYLTAAYDFKYCGDGDDYAAYKMHTVSRRWQRHSLRRDVSRAVGRWGAYAWTCGMNRYHESKSFDFDPCFGCDGYSKNWTPDIQGSTGYPFLLETECRDCGGDPATAWMLGAHMRGYVRNRSGDLLGTICTKVQLIGTVSCSPP